MFSEELVGKEFERISKKAIMSQHLAGGTEESHEKPQSGRPVFNIMFALLILGARIAQSV
jgi:hypothetical protein